MRTIVFRQLLWLLLLCASASVGQAQRSADAIRRMFLDPSPGTVLVASHRAVHDRHPENSLQAIQRAIDLGVDIVEIDVKVSKDGVPFLMHDRTMDRTTTGTGDPEEFTWEELQKFYIEDKGKRTALKIPSLESALQLAEGRILVDLDLKTEKIDDVIKVVRKTNTQEIVFFFDSDYAILQKVQASDKAFMIMPRAHSESQADSAIALFDPPVVHIDFSFYTPSCVQLIQSSYARVWINALGEPDKALREGHEKRALKKLLENGANVIQTDEPALLLKALKEKGLHP